MAFGRTRITAPSISASRRSATIRSGVPEASSVTSMPKSCASASTTRAETVAGEIARIYHRDAERTYLTEGLRTLLAMSARRLSGDANAQAVINLQTTFGGGKTHSMLAVWHLFSGRPLHEFPQDVQDVLLGESSVVEDAGHHTND